MPETLYSQLSSAAIVYQDNIDTTEDYILDIRIILVLLRTIFQILQIIYQGNTESTEDYILDNLDNLLDNLGQY